MFTDFPDKSSQVHESPTPFQFRDSVYLSAVVSHLKDERIARGVGVMRLTKKASLKPSIINSAESGRLIPNSRELRAWASALGIAWEDLWRDTMWKLAGGRISDAA